MPTPAEYAVSRTPYPHIASKDAAGAVPLPSCVSLIGMAASGKSTVGRRLAETLDLAHVDSDFLIEATYGVCLQDVADSMNKERFLDTEAAIVGSVNLRRAVISSGGSVVYREETMHHLRRLGPLVYLDVPLDIILERIARKPDRGLAIAPGQTIEDLYNERAALYRRWADFTLQAGPLFPDECVLHISRWLNQLRDSGQFDGAWK